jgi:phage-related protein
MRCVSRKPDKAIVWLHGEVKTPPLSTSARLETGVLLRRLQRGEVLGLPQSRPMPSVGPRCHELRIVDEGGTWRVMYRTDGDAIVIAEVFKKKTQVTPKRLIDSCRRRLRDYDSTVGERE